MALYKWPEYLRVFPTQQTYSESDEVYSVYIEIPELERYGFVTLSRLGFTIDAYHSCDLVVVKPKWYGNVDNILSPFSSYSCSDWEWFDFDETLVFRWKDVELKKDDTDAVYIDTDAIGIAVLKKCTKLLNEDNTATVKMMHDYFVNKYKISKEDSAKLCLLLGTNQTITPTNLQYTITGKDHDSRKSSDLGQVQP